LIYALIPINCPADHTSVDRHCRILAFKRAQGDDL
jgi:hypothetical protein